MTRNGGVYTPKRTVDFEKHIAAIWSEKHPDVAIMVPVNVTILFYDDKHEKHDVDNLAKSVLDGLQRGGAFVKGDEQVYTLTARKIITDRPRTVIRVAEYDTAQWLACYDERV